jgi:hypothetical protein
MTVTSLRRTGTRRGAAGGRTQEGFRVRAPRVRRAREDSDLTFTTPRAKLERAVEVMRLRPLARYAMHARQSARVTSNVAAG